MEIEDTYWLKVGEGPWQYISQVPKETYMAMERVCGVREDVPPDKINEPLNDHFISDGNFEERRLRVEGWTATLPKLKEETPA